MTNDDFRKELVEHANREYDFFCEFQKIVLSLTDATHNILKRNDIPYYAMYGTLLGVCRDKTFIPWDYDCDIAVSIDDAKQVNDILEKELPDDMYIISNFTCKSFRYNQIRVCKKGYDHGLHVDIYYIYGLPEKKFTLKFFKKKAERLYRIKSRKNEEYVATDSKIRNVCRKLFIMKNKILYSPISYRFINMYSLKLLHKYSLSSAKHCACFSAEFHPLDKCMFGTPCEMEYDGHTIMIPENPEYFLKSFFGDYEEYLPFNERLKEYNSGLEILHSL